MKVAIDNSPLTTADASRGIGFHTKELTRELLKIKSNKFQIDSVNFKTTNLSIYDLVHYQYFNPFFLTLPFKKPATKVILTIHDLIRLIYPNAYPSGIRGKLSFLIQKINLRYVDAIITISETSKKDIVRFLKIPEEKIYVIYLAPQTIKKTNVNKSEIIKKYNLPEKFVLYVGDVNYNKNLLNLAKACKLAKLKLVIVGKQSLVEKTNENIENKSWKKFLEKYKDDKDVLRLGFVESDELNAIFKLASVYCQPSFYEGFGLPLLEAFQRNLPVVASNTQALAEIGDDACLYVDPKNPKDIAKNLKKIIDDKKLAKNLVENGRKRLGFFSWKKCARETYEVYEKVFSEK